MAGPSFLPPFGKRPYVKPESQDQLDDVKRQETEISDKINPAIVEGTVLFISTPSLNQGQLQIWTEHSTSLKM